MKSRSMCIAAVFLAVSVPAVADTAVKSMDIDEAKQEVREPAQVKEAQNIETALSAQMPGWAVRSTFKYAKVTHDGTSTVTEHYIPIVDEVFLVGDYEAIFKGKKAEDINETSAGIKHVGVSVDLREVDAALTEAAEALADDRLVHASRALNDVFKSAKNAFN